MFDGILVLFLLLSEFAHLLSFGLRNHVSMQFLLLDIMLCHHFFLQNCCLALHLLALLLVHEFFDILLFEPAHFLLHGDLMLSLFAGSLNISI